MADRRAQHKTLSPAVRGRVSNAKDILDVLPRLAGSAYRGAADTQRFVLIGIANGLAISPKTGMTGRLR